MTITHREYLPAIVTAIETVGIPVRWEPVGDDAKLPGIHIGRGGLSVDADRLRYAGDVLHEAGHLAVLAPEDRAAVTGTLRADGAEETAALAWSYAMAGRFGLPLEVVFHNGFKAGGAWLRETFAAGHVLGQPMLQYWGMTRLDPDDPDRAHLPLYPEMGCWLRPA